MCKKLKENSAVQAHVNILQGIISRMAANSSNAKTWCTTIVAAIIALLFDKDKTNILNVVYVPIFMFFLLDCYYLGLERFFRKEYKSFVGSLDESSFSFTSIFKVLGPKGFLQNIGNTLGGMISFSTTPYYGVLAVLFFVIKKFFI